MQSIASILEKEANFVEIFNEATLGNHQYGGYPNEQYRNYIRHGDEFMADKWSNELLYNPDTGETSEVNVWKEVKQLAYIKMMRQRVNSYRIMSCPAANQWCNKDNPCTNCRLDNWYNN